MAEEQFTNYTETSKSYDATNGEGYRNSGFIPLDDLVYAPLHALAKANHQLRKQVVEVVRNLGVIQQNGQEETVQLDNINIAYEQVRPEGDEGYSVDNMQVQVPLLSIVPIANLNVEKAEIGFSTEVKVVGNEGKQKINARICSPEQRDSDFLPKVSYKLKVGSIPATEGIMRLTDLLSSNQVAKQLDTTPVALDGSLCSEEQKKAWMEVSRLRAKIKKLRQLSRKISNMMSEQEKLQQISREAFEEDTYEFDRAGYLKAQSDITNRIMEYQESIMKKELEFGLENDYE